MPIDIIHAIYPDIMGCMSWSAPYTWSHGQSPDPSVLSGHVTSTALKMACCMLHESHDPCPASPTQPRCGIITPLYTSRPVSWVRVLRATFPNAVDPLEPLHTFRIAYTPVRWHREFCRSVLMGNEDARFPVPRSRRARLILTSCYMCGSMLTASQM
jgi:hypothetical protein